MYKMIIVDDENGVRNILSDFINNNNFGFEVIGSFSSAVKALEYIESNEVNLVLSDVKMPKMSGIEFIEILSKKSPDIRKVIISGYSEFEYAKAAIKFDVDNYILKPIDYDEIGDVLLEIKNSLDEEKKRKNYVRDFLQMEREAFFADLSMGALKNSENIERQFSRLDIQIPIKDICGTVLEFSFKDYENFLYENACCDSSAITSAAEDIIKSIYPRGYIIPVLSKNEKNIFIYIESALNSQNIDCGCIALEISRLLGTDINVNCLKKFKSLEELIGVISVEESREESLMLLIAHLRFGNKDEAYNLLNRVVSSILNCNTTMKRKTMLDNMIETVIEGLSPIAHNDDENSKNDDEWISRALKFIEANYSKGITRDDVSKHVYMSKSYFDKLFKHKMGTTVHDYLLEIRMQKAFELLKEGMPVYKIAENVGYKDKRNFLRMFKSYTGCTPIELKNRIIECENDGD